MNRHILRTCAAVVITAMLTTLTVAVPAQASISPSRDGTIQMIAPPAPSGKLPASATGAWLASMPSPTIWPPATVIYIPPNGTYGCGEGSLCTLAWDPNYLWVDGQGGAQLGGWAVFYLYSCQEYALSNWLGSGWYLDNQTPFGSQGVRSYFRNQFHNTIGSYITPDGVQHGYNWDPVWYIKNC